MRNLSGHKLLKKQNPKSDNSLKYFIFGSKLDARKINPNDIITLLYFCEVFKKSKSSTIFYAGNLLSKFFQVRDPV